ncbi:MAG TPA: type IV secretory system conjugative DNA transfer family protein [Pyrinomonadaceae bacterium]|nr:type IV secretory system conjugative DNA transfer family protein [Pyrinomonadaceae bacterium]
MSFRAKVERIDADYFIPRPADEPELDSFQAARRFIQDLSTRGTFLLSSSVAGYLFFRSGQMLALDLKWMTFVLLGACFVALVGIFESISLAYPYYSLNQRLTHGSARWATIPELKAKGLAYRSDKPLPSGAVRIGRLSSALSPRPYDLVLPLKQLLTHTGIFGPSGSGKSATFYMNILRDWSEWGSALVMDIKGELYAHTARYFDEVYRLDLENPCYSDLWNPLPACLGNGELAHSIASIVVGYEPENMKVNDGTHYWISGETALMKALCLHLPTIAVNPTLPMIKEYLSRNDLKKLAEEMNASADDEAQIEWGNFTKVDPEKTQGGVITGLNNKIAPLRSPNAMAILRTPNFEEMARGVREINLSHLRIPRTAIYVVLSERQASQYRILLELIFGLAAIEMEASTEKNATPVLMALDEAGNIPPPKLQDKLKIGRFRNTPYLLGFQDVSQIKNKFQENGGKAVLAGIKNQIFLPGIDLETGAYASSLLGPTTVLSRTEVDAPGTKLDSERVSESRRDFKQAPELRRLVNYRQAIAIIDTVDPILFRFPPRADLGDGTLPPRRLLDAPCTLAETVVAMDEIKEAEKERHASSANRVLDSNEATDTESAALTGSEGTSSQDRLTIQDIDDEIESDHKADSVPVQSEPPRLTVVTSAADPNQRELFESTDEEDTCAA